jgi:hypothetical protein
MMSEDVGASGLFHVILKGDNDDGLSGWLGKHVDLERPFDNVFLSNSTPCCVLGSNIVLFSAAVVA